MVVSSTSYGTFIMHTGTLDEVASAMKGKNMKNGSTIFWNGTNYSGKQVI